MSRSVSGPWGKYWNEPNDTENGTNEVQQDTETSVFWPTKGNGQLSYSVFRIPLEYHRPQGYADNVVLMTKGKSKEILGNINKSVLS